MCPHDVVDDVGVPLITPLGPRHTPFQPPGVLPAYGPQLSPSSGIAFWLRVLPHSRLQSFPGE